MSLWLDETGEIGSRTFVGWLGGLDWIVQCFTSPPTQCVVGWVVTRMHSGKLAEGIGVSLTTTSNGLARPI